MVDLAKQFDELKPVILPSFCIFNFIDKNGYKNFYAVKKEDIVAIKFYNDPEGWEIKTKTESFIIELKYEDGLKVIMTTLGGSYLSDSDNDLDISGGLFDDNLDELDSFLTF